MVGLAAPKHGPGPTILFVCAAAEEGSTAARTVAVSVSGVVSHLSAAGHWRWQVKAPPARPHVTVPAKRRLAAARREGATVHWRDLDPAEVVDGVTSPLRTVLDCARDLPFDEALAVADSALRSGRVSSGELVDAAAQSPTRGRQRCLRVARAADERADNPFESVVRARLAAAPVQLGGHHVPAGVRAKVAGVGGTEPGGQEMVGLRLTSGRRDAGISCPEVG